MCHGCSVGRIKEPEEVHERFETCNMLTCAMRTQNVLIRKREKAPVKVAKPAERRIVPVLSAVAIREKPNAIAKAMRQTERMR